MYIIVLYIVHFLLCKIYSVYLYLYPMISVCLSVCLSVSLTLCIMLNFLNLGSVLLCFSFIHIVICIYSGSIFVPQCMYICCPLYRSYCLIMLFKYILESPKWYSVQQKVFFKQNSEVNFSCSCCPNTKIQILSCIKEWHGCVFFCLLCTK